MTFDKASAASNYNAAGIFHGAAHISAARLQSFHEPVTMRLANHKQSRLAFAQSGAHKFAKTIEEELVSRIELDHVRVFISAMRECWRIYVSNVRCTHFSVFSPSSFPDWNRPV
jgi:hypothetical protein